MQLIPALDLLGDDAVRLERGDFQRVLFRHPFEEVLERIVATAPALIHVVDLQGARDGSLRHEVIARCKNIAGTIPLQVSGGLRSLEAARATLDAGASRVIIGTALWDDDASLARFVEGLGDQLVAALDVRHGQLALRGWLGEAHVSVDDALVRYRDAGVARLHVTAIERDGTMRGPDLDLYRHACSFGVPVVAAGGVRDDHDLENLERVGCEAAVMGVGFLARLGFAVDGDLAT